MYDANSFLACTPMVSSLERCYRKNKKCLGTSCSVPQTGKHGAESALLWGKPNYVPVLGQQKRGERDNGMGLGLNRSVRARCSSMAHLVANIQMGNGRTWWEGAERHLRQPWLQKGWRSQWGFGPSLLRLSPCIRSRSREHRRFVLTVLTSLLPCLLPAPRLSYPILPCFLGCHHCPSAYSRNTKIERRFSQDRYLELEA